MPERRLTNNTVELVVRRFDQNYQNMCGFEGIDLELTGYDISHMPIARILRAQLLGWPPDTLQELVPNA